MDVNKKNIFWLIAFLLCQPSELIAMIFCYRHLTPLGSGYCNSIFPYPSCPNYKFDIQFKLHTATLRGRGIAIRFICFHHIPITNSTSNLNCTRRLRRGHMFITIDLENDLGEFPAFVRGARLVAGGIFKLGDRKG